jgi:asparagine synthase (glutamine-hydrolysing)
MAHSLEVRVPFLDHHVVEYCARIPANLKVRRLQTKHLLRQAARGLVPDRIIDKPKIGFFHKSVGSWLDAQTSELLPEYLLAPQPAYAALLDRAEVQDLVAEHINGADASNGHLILALLMLEVWLSTFVPRALTASSPSPVAV